MHKVHTMPIQIYFKHCDPAGIVFYPRYVEMLHDTVEHWFNNGLEIGFDDLHGKHNMGIPMVNLQVDFRQPSRLGDRLNGKLYVSKLGRSSMVMHVQLCDADDNVRVSADLTIVFVTLGQIRSIPAPDEFRQLIMPYVKPEA